MPDDESIRLLSRWRAGDEQAANAIVERYLGRLIALARNRLSSKMRRRIDPEDIVQSAYRSFFRHADSERYTLERGGDLWRLLAAITLHKALGQVVFHQAQKRSIDGEGSITASGWTLRPEAIAREPTPDEALAMTEELENLMRNLKPKQRQILELKLQGATTEEIADEIGRTTRTVRRIMENVRSDLEKRLEDRTAVSGNNS